MLTKSLGVVYFAAVLRITMWLLEADDTPAMLQSRETIPFLVVNVYPQSSVDANTSHKDRIASSFFLFLFTKSIISGIKLS